MLTACSMHRYVISGGPGAGKSTLLEALHQRGYAVSEEVSRRIIIEEALKGTPCLPWLNLSCFAQKVLARMVENYNQAPATAGITFFDRGIPDIIAYLQVAQVPVDRQYEQALAHYPYSQLVFLAPPWQEIYVNDSERWQTFEEAVALYDAIKSTYESLQYTTLVLPKAPVEERVEFIISHIQHTPEVCPGKSSYK